MTDSARSDAGLRAGVGQADITPARGIQIAGDIGRYRPVEEIRDPLFAKAMIVEQGGRRACFVVLDVLAITRQWSDAIRRQAAERFGLDFDAILVHVTQDHAAPSIGHCFIWDQSPWFPPQYPWLLGGDDRYNPVAVNGALTALEQALATIQPVTMKVGRGVDGRVAFNRRFIMRDGTARTHPGMCNPDVLQVEGPADPEVGVMVLASPDGQAIAALLHHTCHPCHGYPQRWISADWPGAWCHGVRAILGDRCVPMVINGFCGNIHHCNHLDPEYRQDHHEMARQLTQTTQQVLARLQPVAAPILDWRVRSLSIPMRRPTDQEIVTARQMLQAHPEPIWTDATQTAVVWDWVYAAMRLDLAEHYDRNSNFDYPIQAYRLGNAAIIAVGGEPFVEEQLRIKAAMPATFVFPAHMCHGYVGYIPTAEAFVRGGYETDTSNGSKLAPQALRMIGDAAIEMLHELYR
ncbi:hypothetical protein HQ590_16670 [bacterium]|nr:hypothetical protein [bacterium]